MTDDPTDIHVLYLKVQDVLGSGQRLQQLCGLVFESFQQAGLTQPVGPCSLQYQVDKCNEFPADASVLVASILTFPRLLGRDAAVHILQDTPCLWSKKQLAGRIVI